MPEKNSFHMPVVMATYILTSSDANQDRDQDQDQGNKLPNMKSL